MKGKLVSETQTRFAQLITPNDSNYMGKAFGGSILSMVDLCAYATASKFAGKGCVTAAIDRVDFRSPIDVGELVELEGRVTYAGRTSVEVTIDIWASSLTSGDRRHTNTARVTLVALEDGKPSPVPRLICESSEEKRLYLEGRLRRELRGVRIAELQAIRSAIERLEDSELDKLIEDNGFVKEFLDRLRVPAGASGKDKPKRK